MKKEEVRTRKDGKGQTIMKNKDTAEKVKEEARTGE